LVRWRPTTCNALDAQAEKHESVVSNHSSEGTPDD
jgi:hypothetical protein